jgi:5-methylcytosine-specific restriction endonuclease McrA
MSEQSEALREAVIERADNRCEYCQLPAHLQVGGFEIDHIMPRSRGGQTVLSNLALACPNCNAHKWVHVDGEVPESGQHALLFNPRQQRWVDHF